MTLCYGAAVLPELSTTVDHVVVLSLSQWRHLQVNTKYDDLAFQTISILSLIYTMYIPGRDRLVIRVLASLYSQKRQVYVRMFHNML